MLAKGGRQGANAQALSTGGGVRVPAHKLCPAARNQTNTQVNLAMTSTPLHVWWTATDCMMRRPADSSILDKDTFKHFSLCASGCQALLAVCFWLSSTSRCMLLVVKHFSLYASGCQYCCMLRWHVLQPPPPKERASGHLAW
eukprot:216358-Chlamydomonas_euryale.AAC.2